MTLPPDPGSGPQIQRSQKTHVFLPEHEEIDIPHALCRSFCEYCLENKSRGALAERLSFDMFDLRPWFGNVMILDCIDDGADFRYRMFGSEVASFSGFDMTGKRVSDFQSAIGQFLLETYRRAIGERLLIYTQHESVHSRYLCTWHRVVCPVRKGDTRQIVACNYPVTSHRG